MRLHIGIPQTSRRKRCYSAIAIRLSVSAPLRDRYKKESYFFSLQGVSGRNLDSHYSFETGDMFSLPQGSLGEIVPDPESIRATL
ncbi:MAG: hypothetical protein AB1861_26430 [Cyanobacteriota bacterium]